MGRWRYMKGCFLLAPANANTQRGDPCPHGTEHVFAQKLAGAACITSTVMCLLERSASVQMRSSSYAFARKLGLSYRCLAPSHPRRRLHWHSRRVRSEQGQCSEVALHERLLLARASKCKHAKRGPLPARYRACFCAKAGRAACITSTVMRLLERSASVQMRNSSYAFARKLGFSYRCLAPSHPRRRLHWHSRRVRSEQGNAARWRYM